MSLSKAYILVSPCRDEALYMRKTINSIVSQTIQPKQWIIVDDGSTDETPKILEAAAKKYDFIKVISKVDRGDRLVGPGVIEAFYTGYKSIENEEYDYICKLDMDLEIPSGYFENLMARMEVNPRIGTCSGKPYFYGKGTELVSEKCGDETSVGMIKFYRHQCFKQIDGFVREVMWDTIDCHRCRMLGWIACSWDDPDIRFIHLRAMGSSHKGILRGRMRHGYGQYFMGTSFWYLTVSSIYRMSRPPVIVGGLAIWFGYVLSMLQRNKQYHDLEFRSFIRKYQSKCLLQGKSKATAVIEGQQEKYWNGNTSSDPIMG